MSPKPERDTFANQLLASKEFFERSTLVLDEADSEFRPKEGMMAPCRPARSWVANPSAISYGPW